MNKDNELLALIHSLDDLDLNKLHKLCQGYGLEVNGCRSKKLLRKKISFILQTKVWGDCSPTLKKQVFDSGLGQPQVKNHKGILTGTTFIRKWKGEIYRLVAVEDGFIMNDQKFKSLSGAAMAVTGTQWSGKIFWKVK